MDVISRSWALGKTLPGEVLDIDDMSHSGGGRGKRDGRQKFE